jgi:antibiotic biosynthesis monooxygenase (ABM) superfamily enzyme
MANTPCNKAWINMVCTRCKPEDEVRFNKWYDDVHIPMLLATGFVKEIVRYKLAMDGAGNSPYLTIYYFADKKAYDAYQTSPARFAALAEMDKEWGKDGFKIESRVQYEEMQRWKP